MFRLVITLFVLVVFGVADGYAQQQEESPTSGGNSSYPDGQLEETKPILNENDRSAVERSLEFLARDGERWINERGCVSCHHVPMMIWAHNEAKRAGLEVDVSKVNSTTNWAFTSMLAEREQFGGADSISQMLLGRDRKSPWRKKPPRHFKTVDPFETLFEILLDRQREDGSWPPEGQLTTPPELTTGWALLALQSRSHDTKADPGIGLDPDDDLGSELGPLLTRLKQRIPASRQKGFEYLRGIKTPHPTHEALVLRVLLNEYQALPESRQAMQVLLKTQNEDGGWSNLSTNSESDAFATGITLYALAYLNRTENDRSIMKAREFLLNTQNQNGSWDASADRIRVGNRSGSLDEVFTYWGTAWAIIGLLRTNPAQ